MTTAKRAQLLAYSSRLAWAFKAGISLLLSAVFALLVWDAKGFCVFFLLFSTIGIITDIVLHFRRNSFFTWDIKDEDVSTEYEVTAEELLSFARNIPKVRLCRLITGIALFPLLLFSSSFSLPITFLASILMNYYPAALADVLWAKKFGVKLPSTYKLIFEYGFLGHPVKGTSITPFVETERDKYIAGQTSTWGYQHSILNPLNNIPTPISPPPIPSCLSNNY